MPYKLVIRQDPYKLVVDDSSWYIEDNRYAGGSQIYPRPSIVAQGLTYTNRGARRQGLKWLRKFIKGDFT